MGEGGILSGGDYVLYSDAHCSAEEVDGGRSDYGLNICQNYSGKATNLTLVSPGYPDFYPRPTECRCMVIAQRHSKVCSHCLYQGHRFDSRPGRYQVNYVNSAFHPSGVGKSSTGLYGWG